MSSPEQESSEGRGAGAENASAWRFARASRAHVVIDAAGYFELLHEAMLAASERIMLLGWDFDTRIRLGSGRRWWDMPRPERYPARLGGFVVWLVRRRHSLRVVVLRWSFGAGKVLLRGSMLLDLIRWSWNRRIAFRLDSALPMGCSRHEKVVVIDDDFAACGGIDITFARWDTSAHKDDDARRRSPGGLTYRPWHDLAMLVEGEAAAALGELARERWHGAGAHEPSLPPCKPRPETAWPMRLNAEFHDVEIGIARTRAPWRGAPAIREVEALFLEHIARARRFIYAESQYFASRSIGEALARRLAEPDPPEIVLVTSLTAKGWLQKLAMDPARVRLLQSLAQVDHAGRFHAFAPLTARGTPIYVHAKLMIVDDEVLRVGSANLNNRSQGMDSECDVFLDAARPGNGHIVPAITRLRHRLLAEHCGMTEMAVTEGLCGDKSMAAMIGARPQIGRRLMPLPLRRLSQTQKALADSALLDPESPDELFARLSRRQGLFRAGSSLPRPDEGE
jgi:phosphatidylserine/phosphatidylglycerophosphate/cardiolipin synthase-like enzyme